MTLEQIAAASSMPLAQLLERLDADRQEIASHEGAGRFLRRHGLTMGDLRDAIDGATNETVDD